MAARARVEAMQPPLRATASRAASTRRWRCMTSSKRYIAPPAHASAPSPMRAPVGAELYECVRGGGVWRLWRLAAARTPPPSASSTRRAASSWQCHSCCALLCCAVLCGVRRCRWRTWPTNSPLTLAGCSPCRSAQVRCTAGPRHATREGTVDGGHWLAGPSAVVPPAAFMRHGLLVSPRLLLLGWSCCLRQDCGHGGILL